MEFNDKVSVAELKYHRKKDKVNIGELEHHERQGKDKLTMT